MKNSRLIIEINQILERIDKKIEEVQTNPGSLTPVKERVVKDNPERIRGRSASAATLKVHKPNTPVKIINEEGAAFQPLLCKNSLRIAKNLQNSCKKAGSLVKEKIVEFGFKPEINEKSKRIVGNQERLVKKHWQSLYELGAANQIKAENKRKIVQAEENNEKYAFKPAINSNKKVKQGVIERNYSWLRSKNEKINIRTEAEQFRGLEECTFVPKTNEFIGIREESEPLEAIKGVQDFLYRHQVAKKNVPEAKHGKKDKRDMTLNEYMDAVKSLKEYLHSIDIE